MNDQTPSGETPETPEAVAAAGEAENAPAENAQELRLLLEDARNKADQHWIQLLRLQADLENTRRRAEKDIENAHKYGLEKFAQELLPVRDSLEMGLAAAVGETETDKLREGMEMTLRMLTGALEKFGVKTVDPAGQAFNPALHQAMAMQESAEHAPNTVVAVMQKGYTLNDRLIRPAMVMVSKAPAESGGIDEKA